MSEAVLKAALDKLALLHNQLIKDLELEKIKTNLLKIKVKGLKSTIVSLRAKDKRRAKELKELRDD